MTQTMKAVLSFVMIMMTSVNTDMAGECDMASFYLELGCTPVPNADNSSVCPDAFTCPNLHPDPTMCYYRGVPYGDRATIPQSLIMNQCSQACSCRIRDGEPQFECAAVDCVEIVDPDMQQDCMNTFDINSCCSTGTVCGKDAIAKLNVCEMDGKTYKEGEIFEPKNTRKSCVCTSDWDGSVENGANCRDINCGLEIHYQDKIFDNCAPVFIGDAMSCPIGFECQGPTTQVIRALNLGVAGSQCVFGNETLNIGDEITVDEKCTKCVCNIPPFVSCTRQNTCNELK